MRRPYTCSLRASRSSGCSGNRPDIDSAGAGTLQTLGKRVHGRCGGDHVVDDCHMAANRGACLECTRNVRSPRNRVGQGRLRSVRAAAPVHHPREPYSGAGAQDARDFECLVEPPLSQAGRGDRYRCKPIDAGLGGHGVYEQPGQYRDDAQIAVKFQSSDEVVDRRRIGECAEGTIDRGRACRAGGAQSCTGYRARSAGDAGVGNDRQFASTGIAEIRDGPARRVAEKADVATQELHRTSSVPVGRTCMILPEHAPWRSHASRCVSANRPPRPGSAPRTRRPWQSGHHRGAQ